MVLLGPLLLAVVSVIWAEEDYFINGTLNYTWDNARNYCQICYKDLTTMTPGNAHIIIQKVIALNLTSGYWIGLRENFSGPIPFSQWSNGAPVIYQNWYPGRPILKKPEVFVPTSPPPTTSTDGTTTSYDSTTTAGTTTHSTTAGTTTHSTTAGTTSTSGTTHTSSTPIDEQILCPTLAKLIACFNDTEYIVTPITDNEFSTSKSSTLIITSSPAVSSTSPSTIRSTSSSTIRSTSSSTMLSTSSTTYTTTTALITSPSTSLMTSTSYSTPIPETDYDYITDSCVALLSFGMWREKHCYESLPFICYDERFTGTVKISNVTHGGSVVTWDKAPGDNVDHYRVELHGSINTTAVNATAINTTAINTTAVNTTAVNTTAVNTKVLTFEFQNLEAGKLYTVKVVPVKCSRDLNYLDTKFYTLPMSISTLTKVEVTTNSIALNWSKPEGGCDNYYVKYVVNGTEHENKSLKMEYNITGLLPGLLHNITARCVVNDSIFGEPSKFELAYTKPSRVQNLTSSNNESSSVHVTWSSSDSNSSSYSYLLILIENVNKNKIINETNTIPESTLKGLTPGTEYTLSVSALVGNPSVKGEAVNINVFTMPKPVTNLTLKSTENTIHATWDLTNGSFSYFRVQLFLNTKMEEQQTKEKSWNFSNLMSTTQYIVSISTIIGNLSSCPVNETTYTLPKPPTNLNIMVLSQTHVELKWNPPAGVNSSQNLKYNVAYMAPFWSISPETFNTTNSSTVISNLISGTKYCFNVSVYAGNLMSDPVRNNASTVTKFRILTLTMLCSSTTNLYCKQNDTKGRLQEELKKEIKNKFDDNIAWDLVWKDGKS